jgi:hypothetical protein
MLKNNKFQKEWHSATKPFIFWKNISKKQKLKAVLPRLF